MRSILFIILIVSFCACENNRFDSDKRQIMAKDLLRSKAPRNRSFDITGFKEDTLKTYEDTLFKKPILYTIDYIYNDSTGTQINKRGEVVFSPDGHSIINYRISDR